MFTHKKPTYQPIVGIRPLLIAACLIALLFMVTGIGVYRATAAPSDPIRAELKALIENVTQANAYRYGITDNAGHRMDTVKIIKDPGGGYLAVYHTYVNGSAKVNLATSSDVMNWTWIRQLAGSGSGDASQPYITYVPSTGGFVIAWEQEPDNHLAFRYYSSRTNLLNGAVSASYDAPRTISGCPPGQNPAEGTPNIYSVNMTGGPGSSVIDVGHHYYSNCQFDRQARGTLTNFNSWTTSAQPNFDNALLYWGVGGNIGDRDATTYKGYPFGVIEGMFVNGDFGSWRSFIYDYQTGNAEQLNIQTHGGSTAFANPQITNTVAPNGQPAIIVSVLLNVEGAAPGEKDTLVYYRTYGDNLALNRPATADSSCNANESPAKAVNGSWTGGNSDKWCSLGSSKWLRVDLGSNQTLRKFVIRHAGAGGESSALNTRDFTVQVSTNGTSWTTVVTVTGNTSNVTTHNFSAVTARYVRLNITLPSSNGDNAARIYELEAYSQ